jgi:hypothetical protein
MAKKSTKTLATIAVLGGLGFLGYMVMRKNAGFGKTAGDPYAPKRHLRRKYW